MVSPAAAGGAREAGSVAGGGWGGRSACGQGDGPRQRARARAAPRMRRAGRGGQRRLLGRSGPRAPTPRRRADPRPPAPTQDALNPFGGGGATPAADAGGRPAGPPPPYDSVVTGGGGGDAGGGPRDFEIVVTDPVKQGEGVSAFVSYKVRRRGARPGGGRGGREGGERHAARGGCGGGSSGRCAPVAAGGRGAHAAGPRRSPPLARRAPPCRPGPVGLSAAAPPQVRSRTTLPQYARPSNEVIRRFRDFAWLHDRLAEENRGAIVPPLPEKNAVQKFTMGTDFIEERRRALQVGGRGSRLG
jgi:hypothetical protein